MDSGKAYFVYIVSSRSRCIYVGVTGKLRKRIWQHKTHAFSGFTDKYKCEQLVWAQMFDDPQDAIAREKQVKGWRREKKVALIENENPNWVDLADHWFHAGDVKAFRDSSRAVDSVRLSK